MSTTKLPLDYDHGSAATQQLTADILKYLDAHGFEAWGQPNRGEYDPNTGRWRPHPNSRRGVPDILGYRRTDGKFLACEVKFGKDRLRDEQIVFLNQVKAAGALAFVAHTLPGFVASFERRGLHRPMATTAESSDAAAPAHLSRCQRCEQWPEACRCQPATADTAGPTGHRAPPYPTVAASTDDPQAPYSTCANCPKSCSKFQA